MAALAKFSSELAVGITEYCDQCTINGLVFMPVFIYKRYFFFFFSQECALKVGPRRWLSILEGTPKIDIRGSSGRNFF